MNVLKKKPAQPRPLEKIYKDLSVYKPGRQTRKLHRELKYYGYGISFSARYPLWDGFAVALTIIGMAAIETLFIMTGISLSR